jgi:hypothetical protein
MIKRKKTDEYGMITELVRIMSGHELREYSDPRACIKINHQKKRRINSSL